MRALLILHRYLGVAVGLLMTLWCLSGFVMMYQAYPRLTEAERLASAAALDRHAWRLSALAVPDDQEISDLRVEMIGERPILRLVPRQGRPVTFDLSSGGRLARPTAADLAGIARAYGLRNGLGAPAQLTPIGVDQWSVGSSPREHQPLYRARYADPKNSFVYFSGQTGEVIQLATRKERLLGWVGSVPHWLYPTLLRGNAPLWAQVVIWSSLLGVFLTATGLYVGIVRFKRYKSGRWSPYHGCFYWHHTAGLVFGVLTLTWATSGLLTMSPWGLLDGPAAVSRVDYSGSAPWRRVRAALAAAERADLDLIPVRLDGAFIGGAVHLVAGRPDGARVRLSANGLPAPMSQSEAAKAVERLGPVLDFRRLQSEDAYYYAHHDPIVLPVYRAILADPEHTRLYIDATTGQSIRILGAQDRVGRWARGGAHSLDFAGLRRRPFWDVAVLLLLAGVTGVCATGTWMAIQRVGRDLRSLRRPGERKPLL